MDFSACVLVCAKYVSVCYNSKEKERYKSGGQKKWDFNIRWILKFERFIWNCVSDAVLSFFYHSGRVIYDTLININ